MLVLLFIFITGFGTVFAAKNTIPGDLLYPVKRASEKVRMALILDKSQKTVLKAEILANRLSEARTIADKIEKGATATPELNKLVANFNSDLKILKNEISAQNPVSDNVENLIADEGALPIEDGQEIFKVLQSDDLKKLLEETKNSLQENNLVTALEKINNAEKITQNSSQNNIVPDQATSTPSQIPAEQKINTSPIIKNAGGSLGSLNKISVPKSEQKADFGIDVERTGKVKVTPMIREK
ncbi:MAG: DUF5667 domain-containing protein [Patescibacteria group bacterium]|nr:DUF5667 domain-containing protein [Patescibacteria group bacterium]MDD5164319.1 DUF5667 domain-containing protein [Patescibacteria group bacterium]MDD5534765.1 DUF5667 domain-containing protein [Patescibacteria group bacterium]